MSRIRPSWYYERLASTATSRENYRRNNPPPPRTTVRSRGPATTLFYRSLIIVDGTDHRVFSTYVDADTLTVVTAVEAGLLTTAPADTAIFPLRGSGVTPSKLHWMKGSATPSVKTTPWQSRYIKYYEGDNNDTTRSHFSMPFSKGTGVFGASDLREAFTALVAGTTRTEMLGAANGRAHLTLERAPISVLS